MVFKKIKEAVLKHRERKRIAEWGKRMPDNESLPVILSAVQKKVAYPRDELFKMVGHNPWEALMHNFSKVGPEMHLRRKPILTRIAVKYALNSIGLSLKYDREVMDKVQALFKKNVEESERLIYAIGAENIGMQTIMSSFEKIKSELEKLLGKKNAEIFITHFTARYFVMEHILSEAPVTVK